MLLVRVQYEFLVFKSHNFLKRQMQPLKGYKNIENSGKL